jgi:hypothetical protein
MVKVLATAGLTVATALLIAPSASATATATEGANWPIEDWLTAEKCHEKRDLHNVSKPPGHYYYCGGANDSFEWYYNPNA